MRPCGAPLPTPVYVPSGVRDVDLPPSISKLFFSNMGFLCTPSLEACFDIFLPLLVLKHRGIGRHCVVQVLSHPVRPCHGDGQHGSDACATRGGGVSVGAAVTSPEQQPQRVQDEPKDSFLSHY